MTFFANSGENWLHSSFLAVTIIAPNMVTTIPPRRFKVTIQERGGPSATGTVYTPGDDPVHPKAILAACIRAIGMNQPDDPDELDGELHPVPAASDKEGGEDGA